MIFVRGSIEWRLAVILLLLISLTGCHEASQTHELNGQTMGTTWSVKLTDSDLPHEKLQQQIENELAALNQTFSTYIEDSELSRLNRAAGHGPVPVSSELLALLRLSEDIYRLSSGAFDISVGPLVNLWGFGPEGPRQGIPDPQILSATLQQVGMNKLARNGGNLAVPGNMYIDFSAIAKGYAVDKVADLIEQQGAVNYMVEIGGEIRTRGVNARGTGWVIGLEAPDRSERRLHRTIRVRDMGMATSGDYRNFFAHEGVNYSHSIDPRTGWPVQQNLASITVLHREAAMADGLATAFTVMGLEEAMQVANQQNLLVLAIIRTDDPTNPYREIVSRAMKQYLNL